MINLNVMSMISKEINNGSEIGVACRSVYKQMRAKIPNFNSSSIVSMVDQGLGLMLELGRINEKPEWLTSDLDTADDGSRVVIFESISWYYCQDKKTSLWVGVCDNLGLTLQGDTEDELMGDMKTIPHEMLQDLLRDDLITKFMEEHNLNPEAVKHAKPGATFDFPNMRIRKVDEIITGT